MRVRAVKAGVIGILIFGILPARTRAGPVTVWSTGFEKGLTGEWMTASDKFSVPSSSLAFEGNKYLNVVGPSTAGGDVLILTVPSTGFQDLWFTGERRVYSGLEVEDRLSVEWSVNGSNWQTLTAWSNLPADDWESFALLLPAEVEDNSQLTLRWLVEFDSASDRILFDQLALSGLPIPEPLSLSLLALGSLAVAVCRRLS